MSLTLRILPRAERDVQAIFDYIFPRSEDGAIRWWNAFEEAAQAVPKNPERYGFAPENNLSEFDVRQFLFKTPQGRMYRGVFVVVDSQVRVLRVRGPGQAKLRSDEMPVE